jgi:hypothetical protein
MDAEAFGIPCRAARLCVLLRGFFFVFLGEGNMTAALFMAKDVNGITEYTSRRTGKRYVLVPEDGGICVRSPCIETTIWTPRLCEAFRLVETLDASLSV